MKVFDIELARGVVSKAPVVGLIAAVAAGAALGPSDIEVWLGVALVSTWTKLIALTMFVTVGIYYAVFFMSEDPAWPLRKRLWKRHELWMAIRDEESAAEPFVWQAKPIPAGTDVSSALDL